MPNVITARLKKNIQVYQLLKGNAALAKSLVIRLLLGALGGLPVISLALFTAFERLSFTVFDMYFSKTKKSALASFRLGVIGLFFKILADVFLIAVFFTSDNSSLVTPVFISLSGVLLGVGQSLTQGHIEDFYQEFAQRYLSSLQKNSFIQHKQNRTFSYWSWSAFMNLGSILLIVALSYFLYNYYKIELLLLFTIALNIAMIIKIYRDERKFQSVLANIAADDSNDSLPAAAYSVTAQTAYLAIINSLSMLLLMSSCYFMFISLCLNDTVKTQFNLWGVILMFVLGYEYLGGLFSHWIGQFLVNHHKFNLLLAAGLVLLTSLAFSRFHARNFDFLPHVFTYVLFLIYPLLMSLGLKTIGVLTLKQIHQTKVIKSKELAYSTFPGHILMAGYCFYLVSKGVGIPSLVNTLEFNLNLSFLIFALVCLYLFLQYSKLTQKKV